MVFYEFGGCESEKEYKKYFFDTLMLSNTTPEYFVDWDKVFFDIREYKEEINCLNDIFKNDLSEDNFKEFITKNNHIIPILNNLLAIREEQLEIYDVEKMNFTTVDFKKDGGVDAIVYFFREVGLFDQLKDIDDLYSYLVGIEVGLNSHARKNRGGSVFSSIIKDIITKKVESFNNLFYDGKKHNFPGIGSFNDIIYKNGKVKFVIKYNFYNKSGGRVKDLIKSYAMEDDLLSNQKIIFIWVTDGQGWKGMMPTFDMAVKNLHIIVNKQILVDNFDEIMSIDDF